MISNQPHASQELQDVSILVVDDDPKIVKLLSAFLTMKNYNVRVAMNGIQALSVLDSQAIDLVLLDVTMPEMDGFETCRRIKADTRFKDIPVLFITGKDTVEDTVEGFQLGGADYITKPFDIQIINARIRTQLELKRARDNEALYRKTIEDYNTELEQRVREKTRELSIAHDKLKILDTAKRDFLRLISHELRTPLTGMLSSAEILFEDNWDESTRQKFKDMFHRNCDRLREILEEALLLGKIDVDGERIQTESIPVRTVLHFAVESVRGFAESRDITIGQIPECSQRALLESDLHTKAFATLIKTAIKFSDPGNPVQLTCEADDIDISIDIEAVGKTIPEKDIPKFFEIFSIVDPITPGGDLGLGPPVAERIIKLFGGSLTVQNRGSDGITFSVIIPKAAQ